MLDEDIMAVSTPESLNCPTCGAPLEADGSTPLIRCNFCRNMIIIDGLKPGEIPATASDKARGIPEEILEAIKTGKNIEAIKFYRESYDVSLARAKYAIEQIQSGHLENPESGFPKTISTPVIISTDQTSWQTKTSKGINLAGFIVPTIILLVVGGFLTFMFMQPGSPFVPNLVAMSPASFLQDTQTGKTAIISQFYNVNNETRLVGSVDSSKGKLLWQTGELPKDTFVDAILTDGTRVFYVSQDDLFAVNQTDGKPTWQIQMPDKLDYGKYSMVLKGDRLLAITQDRTLNAFNTSNGELVWKRVLSGYDREIRLMGERIVILDYPEGSTNYSIYFLNPSDGSQIKVINPICQAGEYEEDDFDPDSGILYDEGENALYLIYGSFRGCIQRYDLESGNLIWQSTQEKAFSFSMVGFNPIQTNNTIYFSDEHTIFKVNILTGTTQILLEDPDYELIPLMQSGNNLLIRARRTLGSERFELWGVDESTGERLWEMVLDNSAPLDPPNEAIGLIDNGEQAWTWHPSEGGIMLLNFQAEPNQLVIQTIDLTTGVSSNELTILFKSVSSDFYSVPETIDWQENLLYLSLDSDLYSIDTSNGKILMKFQ
jgi:outer membrane protein assembly factor BamB/DNA-directed RNA polymerase subunit RPC12/RpoP